MGSVGYEVSLTDQRFFLKLVKEKIDLQENAKKSQKPVRTVSQIRIDGKNTQRRVAHSNRLVKVKKRANRRFF